MNYFDGNKQIKTPDGVILRVDDLRFIHPVKSQLANSFFHSWLYPFGLLGLGAEGVLRFLRGGDSWQAL